MSIGVGDSVRILYSKNPNEIGKVTKVASICGKMIDLNYHLEIDGEQKIFKERNLELIRKRIDKYGSKNIRKDSR